MFHVAGFGVSIVAGSGLTNLTAKQDGYLNVTSSGTYTLPAPLKLIGAAAFGTNISRAQINTPSLRQVALPAVAPLFNTVLPITSANYDVGTRNGPDLPSGDEFGIQATHTDVGAQIMRALAFLGDGNFNVPPGKRYLLRATAAIASVAEVWTQGTMTFDQTLPFGMYSIIGMDVIADDVLGARLLPSNGGMRPGVVGRNTVSILPSNQFRNGNMGEFCRFQSTSPPSLEILSAAAASAAQEIFLDVIKLP